MIRWRGTRRATKSLDDAAAYRWVALRTGPSAEFLAADHLEAAGLLAYCPMTVKRVIWLSRHQRAPRNTYKQEPLFRRYIFCGLLARQSVARDERRHIEGVLSGVDGPIRVPARAILDVRQRELRGEWDESRAWQDRMGVRVGQAVTLLSGPFADFKATVTAIESESVLRLLVDLFGRSTVLRAEIGQVVAA